MAIADVPAKAVYVNSPESAPAYLWVTRKDVLKVIILLIPASTLHAEFY